jgi:hypothetical protein
VVRLIAICPPTTADGCVTTQHLSALSSHYTTYNDLWSTDTETWGSCCSLSTATQPFRSCANLSSTTADRFPYSDDLLNHRHKLAHLQ